MNEIDIMNETITKEFIEEAYSFARQQFNFGIVIGFLSGLLSCFTLYCFYHIVS